MSTLPRLCHRAIVARALLLGFLLAAGWTAAQAARPVRVVCMIGEDEYHTWETLPEFARGEMTQAGWVTTIVQADPADKFNFPGLVEALREADLLVISVRRRPPRQEQLAAVRAYLMAGKPLVGIRTTCHAFAPLAKEPVGDGRSAWPAFDAEVLGAHYSGHHRSTEKSVVTVVPGAENHPILAGVRVSALVGNYPLYKLSPLEPDVTALLRGAIPNQPAEPLAWTRRFGPRQAKVFFTALGGEEDFRNPEFRRLLANGLKWALAE